MSYILDTQLEAAGDNPLVRLTSSILGPFADSFFGNRGEKSGGGGIRLDTWNSQFMATKVSRRPSNE